MLLLKTNEDLRAQTIKNAQHDLQVWRNKYQELLRFVEGLDFTSTRLIEILAEVKPEVVATVGEEGSQDGGREEKTA